MDHGEIVALDRPAALKAHVGADRIRIETDDDDAALDGASVSRPRCPRAP